MKKVKSISLMLLCLTTILTTSCKKSSMDDLTVNISNPVEGTTYTGSIEMAFSINAPNGLDSCIIELTDASESTAYYLNNFINGSTIRNKTTFTYSYTQTTLPSALTAAKFIITVVDLQNKRFQKKINVNVIQ